jgi:hypothetical protein
MRGECIGCMPFSVPLFTPRGAAQPALLSPEHRSFIHLGSIRLCSGGRRSMQARLCLRSASLLSMQAGVLSRGESWPAWRSSNARPAQNDFLERMAVLVGHDSARPFCPVRSVSLLLHQDQKRAPDQPAGVVLSAGLQQRCLCTSLLLRLTVCLCNQPGRASMGRERAVLAVAGCGHRGTPGLHLRAVMIRCTRRRSCAPEPFGVCGRPGNTDDSGDMRQVILVWLSPACSHFDVFPDGM